MALPLRGGNFGNRLARYDPVAGTGTPLRYLFDQTANREIQRREVTDNNNRPDVAQAFPGVYNADHAGFNVNSPLIPALMVSASYFGRWTNDPAGNGNAVDYWFGNQPTLIQKHR